MIRLTIILIFYSTLSSSQTSLDYQLYSKVIDAYILEGIKHNITTKEILVITKYVPDENEVSSYGKEFLNSDEKTINMFLHYDTTKIRLFKKEHIRKGIKTLEKEFFETPTLEQDKFTLQPTVKTITNKKFQSYFKTIFGRQIDKGWRKFYRKYPGTYGIFEFSKITYQGDYAILYVGRHSNGLSGSGDLVILKRHKGTWNIINYINIWMS